MSYLCQFLQIYLSIELPRGKLFCLFYHQRPDWTKFKWWLHKIILAIWSFFGCLYKSRAKIKFLNMTFGRQCESHKLQVSVILLESSKTRCHSLKIFFALLELAFFISEVIIKFTLITFFFWINFKSQVRFVSSISKSRSANESILTW